MKEIFEIILLCSIWNLGVEIVLSDGMALEKVRKWAEQKESKIWEPAIWCIWCRPTIHCAIGFIAAFGIGIISDLTWNTLIEYPFVVAGTSFISGTLWGVYKLLEIRTKYYQHKEQNEYFSLKDKKSNYNKTKK